VSTETEPRVLFRKPSIADIYVKQLRTQLDQRLVPVYPPDAGNLRVGTIGRFTEGRFDTRGHLADRLDSEKAFAEAVVLAVPTNPVSFSFHSADSVSLRQSANVTAGGAELVKASLKFTGDRAVVASFVGVVEHAVRSPHDFDELLWGMYLRGDLEGDEVVVGVHRKAASGTVLVNRKGGVEVELYADPSVMAAISVQGLGAGVSLGEGSQVSAATVGEDLTVAVRAKGLPDEDASRIEDVRGFEGSDEDKLKDFQGLDVPTILADDLLAGADFDTPET
jgi:hypothetical protein